VTLPSAVAQATPASPVETPADVFRGLVEMYRQAGQDAIHATWGEDYPTHKEREAEALRELHAECARWQARFETASATQIVAVPVPELRALLAELDGWPERPTNFGDACDRLSHLIAQHGGEAPE
jgi:hypothetical protein